MTGTIVPNVTIGSNHNNSEKRRKEYLECIRFYTQFSKVYFLENSSYLLEDDNDFKDIPNLVIRKFQPSSFQNRGKGFQEFEMIDNWIKNEVDPIESFVKVTGRYIYPNFESLWTECLKNKEEKMIIQQYLFVEAGVALFFINTEFYQKHFLGLYHNSDDSKGISIDLCVYEKLKNIPKKYFKRFRGDTRCFGIEGGSGLQMQNRLSDRLNYLIRQVNYIFDKHYIWISF
ncbi:MAG: hypothetical protein LH649_12305 [Pseudanabaena sp. CAN_BIN31]|nr:hypothetical protein [Pseudanabaena sp. CAN_BIN31]